MSTSKVFFLLLIIFSTLSLLITFLPYKFQINWINISNDMARALLTAEKTLIFLICFSCGSSCPFLAVKMRELGVDIFIGNVGLCLSFETP